MPRKKSSLAPESCQVPTSTNPTIIKEENNRFPKRLQGGAILAPLFFSVVITSWGHYHLVARRTLRGLGYLCPKYDGALPDQRISTNMIAGGPGLILNWVCRLPLNIAMCYTLTRRIVIAIKVHTIRKTNTVYLLNRVQNYWVPGFPRHAKMVVETQNLALVFQLETLGKWTDLQSTVIWLGILKDMLDLVGYSQNPCQKGGEGLCSTC